jgi:hypothetical protein
MLAARANITCQGPPQHVIKTRKKLEAALKFIGVHRPLSLTVRSNSMVNLTI